MRKPKHNLTGQRFFHLVIERMEITEKSKDRSWRCICRCDCGRLADKNTNYLMRGLTKSCGDKECQYHRQDYTNAGDKNVNFKGHKGIHGSKWSGMRAAAKRRKLEFSISMKEAWDLYEKQDGKCALTGLPIEFGKVYTDGNTASLDRIDSKKGYAKSNVQWVHKDVNKMKMDLTQDRLFELCSLIVARRL